MSWWLSAPQPPPFYPHLGPTQIHICLGLFQAPPTVTNLQSKLSSSPAPCEHQTHHPMLAPQPQPLASNCQHSMLSSFQHTCPSPCGQVVDILQWNPELSIQDCSELLCPGRCWRVHKTLRGSTCQGGQWAWQGVMF